MTEKELKQIYDYLVLRGKKDSQLETITYPATFTDSDSIAVIHNGDNKSISVKDLENCFLHSFTTDSSYSTIIDDTPTQNSTNLVKSGGVYNAVNNIGTSQLVDNAVTTAKIANSNVTEAKLETSVQNKINASVSAGIDNNEVYIGLKTNDILATSVKIQGTGVVSVTEALVNNKHVITIDVPQTLHWTDDFDTLVENDQLIEGHLYATLPTASSPKNLIQALHMAVGVDSYITLWQAI